MNLELLIDFQRREDPFFIHEDLGRTGEWNCDRLSVANIDKKKPCTWTKNGKLRKKMHRPHEIDQIMFYPIDGYSPIILYFTPDREVYHSIVGEAKTAMTIAKQSVLHEEPFYEFTNTEVAMQSGCAGDHFTIIVMNRNDYDKGLRFN